MNYENAADILPEDLLRRVQKFAAGKLIYVPETTEKRPWGETSGYKRYLEERNQEKKKSSYQALLLKIFLMNITFLLSQSRKSFTLKVRIKN